MIYCISDIHLSPGDIIPQYLVHMFEECDATGSQAVLAGDIFNLLPYGKKSWQTNDGDYTIQRFVDLLPREGCDLIFGNHEGNIGWLRELFKSYPQVRIARSLDLVINGQQWHFEHGHRFAYDWRWLQWIADDITAFAVRIAPKQWYWIAKKLGWMLGTTKDVRPQKYNDLVGTVWGNALKWAQSKNVNLVIGHTHTRADIKLGTGITIVDCGSKQVVRIG